MKNRLLAIHSDPNSKKCVLYITGGGAGAIGNILKYGGGSNTLIEARVPYSQSAFLEIVGEKYPDYKFNSAKAAADLALNAYALTCKLSPVENVPFHLTAPGEQSKRKQLAVGIGVTCTLAKNVSERTGRLHQVFIAVQHYNLLVIYETTFNSDRESEENILSDLITEIFIEAVSNKPSTIMVEERKLLFSMIGELQSNKSQARSISLNGVDTQSVPLSEYVIPGSFRPVHAGHFHMIDGLRKYLNKPELPVDFEISVTNVDKPAMGYLDATERLTCFKNWPKKEDKNLLILTNAPTFVEKSRILPDRTFLVGFDTILRIADPKYYNYSKEGLHTAIQELKQNNAKFMVFHRIMNNAKGNSFVSTNEMFDALPNDLKELCTLIPESICAATAASSTAIRNTQHDRII